MRALTRVLERYISKGHFTLIDADGRHHTIAGEDVGLKAAVRMNSRLLPYKILYDPELKMAEAYMDGELTMEPGTSLYDCLSVIMVNEGKIANHPLHRLIHGFTEGHARRKQRLDLRRNKAQVRHHYDLSSELYRLFLDPGMNYSCGYYRSADESLVSAQNAKLNHIAAKLNLREGMKVLEIGGGWGSLAIRIAQCGCEVTVLNVSTEQIKIAKQRVKDAGLEGRVHFVCLDYNEFEGQFDRIVSVGMMEHVGIGNYEAYFAKVRDCLKEDGSALIHSIGRNSPPGVTGPFLNKYIFPGGYCPSLSEVFSASERQGLWVCDNEILRLHYHYTLRDWRRNFEQNRAQIAALYDERFCRMWELYLTSVELGFKLGQLMVFQLIMSKKIDGVPITRGFIEENERVLNQRFPVMVGQEEPRAATG
ncbi:SAM-dependent methyltransferase [Polycladidibacter stylochi]|uniref:SAM-dependent methyltransferase n=1 Tax=Polycladidibacter stylochi TaxID=1807766 RepID=UPI00083260BE|nr:cyclopropane-fatty-acyl-phospholipid synthase family protein [Pseudovibrio stylochi]